MDFAQSSENKDLDKLILATNTAGAARLARRGDYLTAERILNEITGRREAGSEILDLQARICSQQGRLDEAEESWRRLLELEPENEAARAALDRLARLRRLRVRWTPLRPWVWGLALALLLILLVGATYRRLAGLEHLLSAEQRQLQSQLEELPREVAAISMSPLGSPPEQVPPKLPEVEIDLPGVLLSNKDSTVMVTFEEGLFLQGTELHPEATALLTELAHQLEPHNGQVSIQVIGFTDDKNPWADSEFSGNTALSLGRASAVVEHLLHTTRLPAHRLSAQAAGDRSAPYPNSSDENRARNRTVVVWVTS